MMIACAAPPSGGRADLTPRFSSKFNLLCMPEASQSTLTTIFSSILKNFLSIGFQDKVKNLEPAAITSVIEIYSRIQTELRPTPQKFHYQFNLRDVSKVIQGMCMVKPVSISNDELFMKLFVNETFRVFYDRLINDDDRKWYKMLILELLSKNFKMSPDYDDIFVNNKIMFGDLLKLESPV
jgi:dynein heavy chain